MIQMEEQEPELCGICGKAVKTMAYRKTGVCSEGCNKVRKGDIDKQAAQVHAAVVPVVVNYKEVNPHGIV